MSFPEIPAHVRKAANFEYPHLSRHAKRKKPVSHRTMFYMKEYGPHSHIVRNIVRASLKVTIFAAAISSFGGIALESIKAEFLAIMPLVILMPALNDMLGDFGTIVSSRFSAMLLERKFSGNAFNDPELRRLFLQILAIGAFFSAAAAAIALAVSFFSGFGVTAGVAVKVMLVTSFDILLLVCGIFSLSVIAGVHFYKKGEDPNNFLIPIVTSVADFGNIIVLAGLVTLFF